MSRIASPPCPAPPIPPGYWHARDSLLRRHGIDLDVATHRRLGAMARDGHRDAVLLHSHSPGRPVFAFRVAGRWAAGVWAEATGTVITFLPPHVLDQYRRLLGRLDAVA